MTHKFINEIKAGETIDDIYMVNDPILRSTTNGGLYIAMFISDKTGLNDTHESPCCRRGG